MKKTAVRVVALITGLLASISAFASESPYNIQTPVTHVAADIFSLHMLMFWICVAIFVAVFSVMFYSVYHHRKSKGAVAASFHESITVEILWTIVPVLILAGMAWPATKTVLAMKDTTTADITIKATGYQWKWAYDYMEGAGKGIQFYSTLSTPRAQIDRGEYKGENYLLEVDNEVVVPVGKKIRVLLTAQDVIHAWWVPAFGVKQDAIPGFIRDTWFRAEKEGIYRGNCAELCGKDHGFMPIVVRVVSDAEYAKWVAEKGAVVPLADFPARIYFAVGKAAFAEESAAAIKAAGVYLSEHADQKIDITGYTDKTGSLDTNKELAKERALAVRDALKAAGVAADRINMKPPALVTEGGDGKQGRRVDINSAS